MSPELLLHKFGYIAVFIGTFLEGETILVMAGFFAQRGYLQLVGVILVAAAGAYVGHVFWFWLGRTKGVQLLERFPKMKKHFGKGIRIFERYGAPAIFITQWLYGLRVTCAVIIGISRISVVKFLVYEAITCVGDRHRDGRLLFWPCRRARARPRGAYRKMGVADPGRGRHRGVGMAPVEGPV